MDNLLRTRTESQVKPADLKHLLTAVKEDRRQSYDVKLSDPFYDSLEGFLVELKMSTIDDRDAEVFFKPFSKVEVPDYYEIIANPMDFQTMLKKVKYKQYKSKREFQDDLELIWSNCFTYNATENHPLRQCVERLKAKADRLLKYTTPLDLPHTSVPTIKSYPDEQLHNSEKSRETYTPWPPSGPEFFANAQNVIINDGIFSNAGGDIVFHNPRSCSCATNMIAYQTTMGLGIGSLSTGVAILSLRDHNAHNHRCSQHQLSSVRMDSIDHLIWMDPYEFRIFSLSLFAFLLYIFKFDSRR